MTLFRSLILSGALALGLVGCGPSGPVAGEACTQADSDNSVTACNGNTIMACCGSNLQWCGSGVCTSPCHCVDKSSTTAECEDNNGNKC
jgi:hypothetical protein